MMFVHLDQLEVDETWKVRANAALDEVVNADPKLRNAVIAKHQGIWRAARSKLRKLSSSKCWYSEAPWAGSTQDVDHFRPKNEVTDDKEHGGYWWLAFDPDNFRLSCQICNQFRNNEEDGKGGKLAYFPLLDPDSRCSYRQRKQIKNMEFPLLLDPCNRNDIGLLWFEEDGMPVVREDLDETDRRRVERSIELYNLGSASLVNGRATQIKLARQLLLKGFEAQKKKNDGDVTQSAVINTVVDSLKELLHPDQPYSEAVRCAIAAHQSFKHPWINHALRTS